MATGSACLLIADISGYTGYLAGVEIDHAQDILADLMNTIVSALRPGFRLAKLEGDAAFTYAITERIDGSILLDTIERCFFGFRRRRRDVRQATSCECNACVRIPDLNLKFVVHFGKILRQRVAGREELLGSDVIVVHRLLKNTVVEATGIEAYALFSEACVDTPEGTIVRLRFAAPISAKERAHMRQMESFVDQAIQASGVLLTEQLDAELERARLEMGEEPDLPAPRPNGPLAGISLAP